VHTNLLFPSIVAALSCATTIFAQELTMWSDAGNWQIFVDPASGNGCLMQTELADNTRVRIGAVPIREGGFIAVLNKEWQDIDEGATAVLTLDFDGEIFAGDAEAITNGEWRGGYAFFNNPEFVEGIAKRRTLVVSGEGDREVTIDLTGTANAVNAVLDCQKKQ
jgi:hypothetical protein